MKDSIEIQNKNFILHWINYNPNFKNITYNNHIIKFSNGDEINLYDFLILSLLDNPKIKQSIYTMDELLFKKIIYTNVEIYKFMNPLNNVEEYIKHIKITPRSTIYITTSNSNIEIEDAKPLEVLQIYNNLSKVSNGYVSMKSLLRKLNKPYNSNYKKDINFFELINSNRELDLTELSYVNYFSKYMYDLMCFQDYLVGDAKKTLELYNHKMAVLSIAENLNKNQRRALNLFNDNIQAYNLKLEKETIPERKASYGFSSLVLIIVSVVVTLALITLLIIIN